MGKSHYVSLFDAFQFDDYSQYVATRFDPVHKAKVKAEQFPKDCQNAFDLGVKLAGDVLREAANV